MVKKILKTIFLIVPIILLINACSNDFELTDKWEDIPVVYGLLDQTKTFNYIKVQKAFLDKETGATIVAQISDSLYYKDLLVELQELAEDGTVVHTEILDRVKGEEVGLPKEEGIFANEPNYLYKTVTPLKDDSNYRLVINNNENNKAITAETSVVGDFNIRRPGEDSASTLSWSLPGTSDILWNRENNGMFYDGILRIYYTEQDKNNPSNIEEKHADWELFKNLKPDTETEVAMKYAANRTSFFTALSSLIEPNPNVCRRLVSSNLIIFAGGEEIEKYIDVSLANTGVTGANTVPTYTNIDNGVGIFSSRYTKVRQAIFFTDDTQNKVTEDENTQGLQFLRVGEACN